jgi:hypothetical protein
MRKHLLRAALLIAGGVLVLFGWVALGRQATDRLRDSGRNFLAFADVDCTPPAPLSRADFLGEVQYLSNSPDRLPLSDDGLAARLATAFAAHPSVERVERVEVLPRRVRVSLVYRSAVLAVPGPNGPRAVDGQGVLLPQSAPVEGLPRLGGPAVASPGVAGTRWKDSRVEAAARVADYLRAYQEKAKIEKITVEGEDVMLFARGARFRWGRPPGREASGEPGAASKALRLQEIAGRKEDISGGDYDLTKPVGGKR